MGERIKILYTIPNFNTAGSGRALLNVISRIDRLKFEPHVCCRHEKGELFKTVEDLGVPVHIAEFTTSMKPRIKGFKNVYKLSKFFRKINPDIIHSYNYSDDYSEALAAKFAGIKWIYTKKNMGWGSNAWKVRTFLAEMIIPQNQEMVDSFFRNSDKLALIPIGIDTAEFANTNPDKILSEKFNSESMTPVIITVANLIPIKGVDFLIEAMSAISKKFPKAVLLIIGEDRTEHGDELKRLAAKLSLSEKIIFEGKQSDIKPFFGIADLFVLASRKEGEGGPISILEAMASGIITLGSDVPGIRDQFREFPDQLFEPENSKSIADKVEFVLELNGDKRKEKILKQKEFIQQNYSLENEVSQLEKLYTEIVK